MKRAECVIGALVAVLWMAPLSAQQPTGTIRGHVTDGANHHPLSGGTVAAGTRSALTQADGRFFIMRGRASTDTLRRRLIGYAPAEPSATAEGGGATSADV